MTLSAFAFLSHFVAAISFLVLAVLVAISWRRGGVGAWLIAAAAASAVWSAIAADRFLDTMSANSLVAALEILRTGCWLAFLHAVSFSARERRYWFRSPVAGAIAAISISLLAVELWGSSPLLEWLPMAPKEISLFGKLLLAVLGVLLVENFLRNTPAQHRWAIKFLCFGVGGLFFYDFFLYADALLFYQVSPDLLAARGLTNALIVPLITISARRNPDWSIDVFVSRQVVFYSATLVGAGAYLIMMAAAGFYIREFGGEWGTVLEAAFLFAAILCLLLLVFSGTVRAWFKSAISRHFFSYKYDYRAEWSRFITTISTGNAGVELAQRILAGVCNIVDSPEGAVWVSHRPDRVELLESWNFSVPSGARDVDPSLISFLEDRETVVNVVSYRANPDAYPGLRLPDWILELSRAWLIVPLLHHERFLGFILLAQPRAARTVGDEDYVLLTTVGRQAASYLAEQQSARALAESQQFDQFNRRFAFVLHDIKNLVSQLSLLVQNFEKHKDNPAFQEDVLQTVRESVEKMNGLLVRLHQSGKEAVATVPVDLRSLMQSIFEANRERSPELRFEPAVDRISVVADRGRLEAVISHLIDNAFEAVDVDGCVTLRLGVRGRDAVIEVEDSGTGMDEAFIRNELFRPFRSTKSGGFGLGTFESREFVQECGGRMEVLSEPGHGTTFSISLPALPPSVEENLPAKSVGVS